MPSVVVLALGALIAVAAAPRVESTDVAEASGAAPELALGPLSASAVPQPPNIDEFVRDRAAAIRLGKALFWDMQAGSDGQTACASCHFSAGADSRSRNQISPRGGEFDPNPPNHQFTAADFPLHTLNVSGSQGVRAAGFRGITPGNAVDDADPEPDPVFNVDGVEVRQVTGRNAPSAINAVFNFRNFHDGRAQNVFNGVNPFGERDADARVGHVTATGDVEQIPVQIENASLASQAVGPPNNSVEMAAAGRTFPELARKLLSLQPLAGQKVSSTDSVLSSQAAPGGGLTTPYADMIKEAFEPAWWDAAGLIEENFSLYWGLAIQEYEATLVSDDTPFDRFMAGDESALSAQARAGLAIFDGSGRCTECHLGPELTSASVANVQLQGVVSGEDSVFFDTGFANIGVRPTGDDPGIGGGDPFGGPLSEARRQGLAPDVVQGAFKVPSLRNVALTAPYMHNGGLLTLRQVVDFYSRGGDVANAELHPDLKPLGLTEAAKDALVVFLESLTDDRVRRGAAPFDHPELRLPAGAQTNADGSVMTDAAGEAVDCFLGFPATGSAGGTPPPGFLAFVGSACDATAPSPAPAPGSSGGSSPVSTPQTPQEAAPAVRLGLSVLLARARGSRLSILARCSEPCVLQAVARRGRRIVGRSRQISAPARSTRIHLRIARMRPGRRVRVDVMASTVDGRSALVRRTVRVNAPRIRR